MWKKNKKYFKWHISAKKTQCILKYGMLEDNDANHLLYSIKKALAGIKWESTQSLHA